MGDLDLDLLATDAARAAHHFEKDEDKVAANKIEVKKEERQGNEESRGRYEEEGGGPVEERAGE